MKIFTILFCFFTSICLAQKQYEFDYLTKYETNLYKDSIQTENEHLKNSKYYNYYLTNSKNNNYIAIILEKDSLNYRLVFKDHINGLLADVVFLKKNFHKAEFINILSENVGSGAKLHDFHDKNQDFFILKDTVINNKVFKRYKLSVVNAGRAKKYKLGSQYYIIDNSTDFHLPILNSESSYNEWKLHKNIPNGIYSELYTINYFGKLIHHVKLQSIEKIDIKIIIK